MQQRWALLGFLTGRGQLEELRAQFFRAGHAHAGVLLVLSLVSFLYVDRTEYSTAVQWLAGLLLVAVLIILTVGLLQEMSTQEEGRSERSNMSPQSRLVAGIVLIIVPTVEIGGASILSLLIADPSYGQNDLRQDLWRAGHAHAGVWLVLSLVALRYVDEASLSEGMRWLVRLAFPAAAILMPLAFFLSVLSPEATEPNALINLAFAAGVVLAVGLLVLGVGLIRGRNDPEQLTGAGATEGR